MDGENFLQGCGVPRRYLSARVGQFSMVLVEPNGDGLFITGDAGVGKTHLATAWMRKLVIDGLPAFGKNSMWVSVPDMLAALRATFGGRCGTENDVLSDYMRADILVLDDLGAEQCTDWTGQAVYRLISRRINDLRPTIVTSNLNLNQIDVRDPRLASRLASMAYQRMEGADRRLPVEEKK